MIEDTNDVSNLANGRAKKFVETKERKMTHTYFFIEANFTLTAMWARLAGPI